MELNSFDTTTKSKAGVKIYLKDLRTGKETDGWIQVHGPHCDEYDEATASMTRAVADRMEATGKELTNVERSQLACKMLGALTMDWGGFAWTDNAEDLYSKYPAIKEQIDRAIHDRANFAGA